MLVKDLKVTSQISMLVTFLNSVYLSHNKLKLQTELTYTGTGKSSQLEIVKPESKSPIPCPNRPQILTLRSDQV